MQKVSELTDTILDWKNFLQLCKYIFAQDVLTILANCGGFTASNKFCT